MKKNNKKKETEEFQIENCINDYFNDKDIKYRRNIIDRIYKQKRFNNSICLTIDEQSIKDFERIYFKLYPKRKKRPIEKPYPPNLNQFIIWKRPQQNATKQIWKMFIKFLAREHKDLLLENCNIHFHFVFPDKRRRDLDNYLSTSAKLIIDGLTDDEGIGLLVDDSYQKLQFLSSSASYEKGVSKTIIIIEF